MFEKELEKLKGDIIHPFANVFTTEDHEIYVEFKKMYGIYPYIEYDVLNNNIFFELLNKYNYKAGDVIDNSRRLFVQFENYDNIIDIINKTLTSLYDGSFIEKYYYNIFVYGTLKKGFRNDYLTVNSIRNVPTTTIGIMYDSSYGFPILSLKGAYKIKGEVITIPKIDLQDFDSLEGYPDMYQRELINVEINGQQEKAFVYVMNHATETFPQSAIIESGQWRLFND